MAHMMETGVTMPRTTAPKRGNRITFTVNDEIYEAIKEAAAYSGVSLNAYCAVTVGRTARVELDSRRAMMVAAQNAIGSAFDPEAIETMLKEHEGCADES